MKKNKYHRLETPRLSLRKLEVTDWETVSYLRSDKLVNQFVRRANADTREKALAFIERTNLQISNDDLFSWCISLKKAPAMIGSITLWNLSADSTCAEVGYDLKPGFQKQGIMSEALQAVLAFGFGELELQKIEAYTERRNEASRKLLLSNGFLFNEERKDEENSENMIFEIYRPL